VAQPPSPRKSAQLGSASHWSAPGNPCTPGGRAGTVHAAAHSLV